MEKSLLRITAASGFIVGLRYARTGGILFEKEIFYYRD